MRRTYILILLSMWIQFDDVIFTALPTLQHAPLAADDDQYLSVQRVRGLERLCSRQKAGFVGLQQKIRDSFSICTGMDEPLGSKLADDGVPSPLYLFMSLQL
jgi:hypothetical protein